MITNGNFKDERNALSGCAELVDNMRNVVFQVDEDGRYLFLNKSWVRVMGYELNEVLGTPFYLYLHTDDLEKTLELFRSMMQGKEDHYECQVRHVTKSGKIVWVKTFASALRDDRGNIIGMSGTLHDVTEEKHNQNILELLANNIQDLIALHEMDGTYKYVFPSVSRVKGYSPDELIGKHPKEYLHPDDFEKMRAFHGQFLKDENHSGSYITFRYRTKNGEFRWFETDFEYIRDEKRTPIAILTSSRDITARKKAESQVLESLQKEQGLNELKSRFISFASHEIRTPLASIRTSAELLEVVNLKAKHPNSAVVRYTKNIYSEVDRLGKLMDEILSVSKIESNAITYRKEKLNIVVLIKDVIKSVENIQSDQRKATLIIEGINNRIVLASPLLLNHIIKNLISNAFKFSVGSPAPVISLNIEKDFFTIRIKDFGIGIPNEEKNKIFEAFHRAENAKSIQGTGLGMFIIKSFVDLHGGTLLFESEVGQGSEFVVSFNKK